MSDQPLPADPVSGNAGAPLNLSLEPLLAGGQTALAPDREVRGAEDRPERSRPALAQRL